MKDTHSRLEVKCSWCGEIMQPGRGPEKDQISHGCCCDCKHKYFPTLADASECQMEIIDVSHDDYAAADNSPRDVFCHVITRKCKVCEREEISEPEECGGECF
jgi:hypothetical protein